jgi:hypothetical protein
MPLVAEIAAAVSRRVATVSEDVYEVILREIPELRDNKPLLASSVHSSVGTCLQVMQHQIDLGGVPAPRLPRRSSRLIPANRKIGC